MSSLIECPGCQHKLTLPESFVGQRVQCPKCSHQFAALATLIPAMEVDSAQPIPPIAASGNSKPAPGDAVPPMQSAYERASGPNRRTGATTDGRAIFCAECGTKYAQSEDACPACGYCLDDLLAAPPRPRRRPLRELQPIRSFFPIVGAILIPLGVAFFIAAPIADEVFRRGPRSIRELMVALCCLAGGLTELTALVFCCIWLYQAWRVVLHGDEEYSPGLMVGLLFVPFFNIYWMFRVIPGLSTAIHRELRYMAPHLGHSAGSVPGVLACVFLLIPYFQPIAICMFLAWMLIANNALQRLVRINDQMRAREEDEEAGEPNRVTGPVAPREV